MRVLAGVVSGHATSQELGLVEELLVRLGTPAAEVAASLEEIRALPTQVRVYRMMYRTDPGTAAGVRDLERLICDPATAPRLRHEAMQKAIFALPGPNTYALHRKILAGECRLSSEPAGPDAYQIRLMAAYGATSCEEALRNIEARTGAPQR
jgi:hypothetical protein